MCIQGATKRTNFTVGIARMIMDNLLNLTNAFLESLRTSSVDQNNQSAERHDAKPRCFFVQRMYKVRDSP